MVSVWAVDRLSVVTRRIEVVQTLYACQPVLDVKESEYLQYTKCEHTTERELRPLGKLECLDHEKWHDNDDPVGADVVSCVGEPELP